MAINATDIAILKSERFTDDDDGGGAMTNTVIPNGIVNNLWDDISRDVLAFGGVSMRKMFCAVRSANTDKALGGHTMLLADSAADNVSTILFETGGHYDERITAQGEIEQYVVIATRSALRPVGTQRQGQRSIVVYTDAVADAPEIGEVLVLRNESEGIEQPVKVTRIDVKSASYTYLDRTGNYQRYSAYELTLSITQPLLHSFAAADPAPAARHSTEIFKTQSNNSANYYGIKPLAAAANVGDRAVQVDSIFAPLVPSATTEQAMLDQRPGLLTRVVQPTGNSRSLNLGYHADVAFLTLPQPWVPGSLRVTINGTVYADDGKTLQRADGTERLKSAAVVDSVAGTLQLDLLANNPVSVQYLPGAAVELMPYTTSFEITAGNRQLTYTQQLGPVPMPGSVRVEYQYLGRWYVMTDDGNGVLSGDGASGSANYQTGSISYSLPGEPDQGTKIITTWSQSPYSAVESGAREASFNLPLPGVAAADSVTLTWQRGGSSYTATSDASGALTGDASGTVVGNRIVFNPSQLPTSDIDIAYDQISAAGNQTSELEVPEQTGGDLTLDLQSSVVPGTVEFTLTFYATVKTTINGVVTESRVRRRIAMIVDGYSRVYRRWGSRYQLGTMNAATGVITLDLDTITAKVKHYVENNGTGQFVEETVTMTLVGSVVTPNEIGGLVRVSYYSDGAAVPATHTQLLSDAELTISLADTPLLAGGSVINVAGHDLIDRGDGRLYTSWDYSTAAGVQCGLIDYKNALATVSYAALGAVNNINASLISAAGGIGALAAVSRIVFRTSASPLRPSGLQFIARRAADTALLRADTDTTGNISGVFDVSDQLDSLPQPGGVNGYALPIEPVTTGAGTASGHVDFETGVVEINFTQPVILSTLTYNAVTYATVPLDPDVLGLNPVRLPTNGRVAVFKPGYMVVIHNTQTQPVASPAAAQVIDCGRTDLAVVTIQDAAGVDLDPAQYVVDKSAGLITLADPFVLQDVDGNSLTLPLTVSDRIEDSSALGGVTVGGELSLLTQLTHDYPAAGTFVSAAIWFGVLQARVKNLRDYQIDDSTFDGSGDSAAATYDTINYPILIDNRSAVEDRWKLRFASTTGYECISERRGVVGTGSINADFSPINPYTGQPYFTIKSDGWGGGWVSSNVLLFDTVAAAAPFWAIRTALPSHLPAPQDSTVFEFRAEAD